MQRVRKSLSERLGFRVKSLTCYTSPWETVSSAHTVNYFCSSKTITCSSHRITIIVLDGKVCIYFIYQHTKFVFIIKLSGRIIGSASSVKIGFSIIYFMLLAYFLCKKRKTKKDLSFTVLNVNKNLRNI